MTKDNAVTLGRVTHHQGKAICFKNGQQLSQVVCPAHLRAQPHRDETRENVQFKHLCRSVLTHWPVWSSCRAPWRRRPMGGLIRPTRRTGWLPPSPPLKSHCECRQDKHNLIIISVKTWWTKSWFGLSCERSDYYVKTYPDSSMTGAWLTDFSFRMSIVSRQDRDGNSVRGRDRWRHLTVTFHHLEKGKKSFRTNPQLRWDFGEAVKSISHHGLVSIGVSGLMKPLSHIHLLLMNFDLDANKHTE